MNPSLTPRDGMECDMELMKAISQLAKKYNLHIQVRNKIFYSLNFDLLSYLKYHQTHIAETLEETKIIKTLHKNLSTYAEVYDAVGLLTNKVKI